MGEKRELRVKIIEHATWEELGDRERKLLREAAQAASKAYAPYSNFRVGAAIRLQHGRTVTGNNQENASFPAGCCAERTALYAAMSTHPSDEVEMMAIVATTVPDKRPVSPCGVCRQAMLEQEKRQQKPFRVLLGAPGGSVIEIERASDLLPLSFDGSFLQSGE